MTSLDDFDFNKLMNPKNNIKKCNSTCCILTVHELFFQKMKGKKIDSNIIIYFSNRQYEEKNAEKEASAVIGISVKHKYEIDKAIDILRTVKQLGHIAGIEELHFYKQEYYDKMMHAVSGSDEMLMLFTIEPKGKKKLKKYYPTANLCLAGGKVNKEDNKDPDNCMIREIYEELHINLPKNIFKAIIKIKYSIDDKNQLKECYVLDMDNFLFY
jgi:hypothetical protein